MEENSPSLKDEIYEKIEGPASLIGLTLWFWPWKIFDNKWDTRVVELYCKFILVAPAYYFFNGMILETVTNDIAYSIETYKYLRKDFNSSTMFNYTNQFFEKINIFGVKSNVQPDITHDEL